MAPASSEATLPDEVDLHARPAAEFVRAAMSFEARIEIRAGDRSADAKSLLLVLALGARRGTTVTLIAEGADAEQAVTSLAATIAALS